MISILIALVVWGHLLIPTPINLVFDLLVLGFTFFRFRNQVVILLIFLAAAQSSLHLQSHPSIAAFASDYKLGEASLVGLETGSSLTKVSIKSMVGCDECTGAKGQYVGPLEVNQVVTGTFLFRTSYGFGEFVAKGKGHKTPAPKNPFAMVRSSFLKALGGVSTDAQALVAGLSIGDTSKFNPEFGDKLKLLSLTHLNAVSGANCAIVVGGVFWLLGFVSRRRPVRVALAIAALALYVQLVGGGASVTRAAVMALIVLLAIARGVWPLAALSFTVAALLLFDPNYATDYGFALSVLATAGILVLVPTLTVKFESRVAKPLAISLAATVAAQLWCMPVLLTLQPGLPTYAVVANLLVEPAVAPVTILGICAAVFAWPIPLLASVLSFLASIPAQWIVAVTNFFSALPAVTLDWHTGLIGMLVLVAALSFWLIKRTKLWMLITASILAIELAFGFGSLVRSVSWLPSNWTIVNCDVGQGDALVIRDSGLVAVVDVGREDEPIDSCLNSLGVKTINLLVLTHFDLDHVGGLAGALKGRQVETAMVTPFKDDRPAATMVSNALVAVDSVIKGGVGVTGVLGQINWEVLNPTATAEEVEDSNDGSIAMRWVASGWTLYTMADLGERGQMRLASRLGMSLAHPNSGRLILKVSHHGSADQYPELIEAMHPDIALISVGAKNSYGHPTKRLLAVLETLGTKVLRTDKHGALAIDSALHYAFAGGG